MRDLDYRRTQEAKHYKKRFNTAVALGRFDKKVMPNGNEEYVATYPNKYDVFKKKTRHINGMTSYEKERVEKAQYKRWKFQLKNDSLTGTMDSWSKRYCRRTHRHFQKMVDYWIPDKKFLVRAQVIYPRDIV